MSGTIVYSCDACGESCTLVAHYDELPELPKFCPWQPEKGITNWRKVDGE